MMTSSCVSGLASIDGVGINLSPQWFKYFMTNTWKHSWINTLDNPWWRHQMERVPRNWPFVRGIHRPSMNSPQKGQWCGALMLFLIGLTKRLSKQSWGWWFETPSRSLWRHCNTNTKSGLVMQYTNGSSTCCMIMCLKIRIEYMCSIPYYTVVLHTINTVTNWHPVLSWTRFSNVWMCVYWSS